MPGQPGASAAGCSAPRRIGLRPNGPAELSPGWNPIGVNLIWNAASTRVRFAGVKAFALEESGAVIPQVLPADLDALARQSGSLRRARKVGDAAALLRLLRMHAAGLSLQQTVLRARQQGLGALTPLLRMVELIFAPAGRRRVGLQTAQTLAQVEAPAQEGLRLGAARGCAGTLRLNAQNARCGWNGPPSSS